MWWCKDGRLNGCHTPWTLSTGPVIKSLKSWDRSVPLPYDETFCWKVDTPVHCFSLTKFSIGPPVQVVTGSRYWEKPLWRKSKASESQR